MSGITVAEISERAFPPQSTLLAGTQGLDRDVSWPSVLRTRPPAFHSLKGGELLLISMESLHVLDPGLSLSRLLQSVTRVGVAAAAIVGEATDDARTLAADIGLPLFQLPLNTHLEDLERSVTRTISEWHNEVHHRAQGIYQRLTELAIEERGVGAILSAVAEVTGKTTILADDTFEIIELVDPTGRMDTDKARRLLDDRKRAITQWLRTTPLSASNPPVMNFDLDPNRGFLLVAPVVTREGIAGYCLFHDLADRFGELDRLAIVRTSTACAIDLVRERAIMAAEDRAGTAFLDELFTGPGGPPEILRARARRLGINLDKSYAVILAEAPGHGLADPAASDGFQREIVRVWPGSLARGLGARIVGLVPITDTTASSALRESSERVAAQTARYLGDTPPSIGLGRPRRGADGLRLSYQEAEGALTLGIRLFGPGRSTYFGDLGVYRLLLGLRQSGEFEAFFEDTLSKLVEYDRRSDGELIRTLEAYFGCHGSPTEASERIHVHRNTLLYRLQRIQAITGLNLEDAETRLALHLALRVREIREAYRQDSTLEKALALRP